MKKKFERAEFVQVVDTYFHRHVADRGDPVVDYLENQIRAMGGPFMPDPKDWVRAEDEVRKGKGHDVRMVNMAKAITDLPKVCRRGVAMGQTAKYVFYARACEIYANGKEFIVPDELVGGKSSSKLDGDKKATRKQLQDLRLTFLGLFHSVDMIW